MMVKFKQYGQIMEMPINIVWVKGENIILHISIIFFDLSS